MDVDWDNGDIESWDFDAAQRELEILESRNESLVFISLVAAYCRDIAIIVSLVYIVLKFS